MNLQVQVRTVNIDKKIEYFMAKQIPPKIFRGKHGLLRVLTTTSILRSSNQWRRELFQVMSPNIFIDIHLYSMNDLFEIYPSPLLLFLQRAKISSGGIAPSPNYTYYICPPETQLDLNFRRYWNGKWWIA